MRAAAVGLLRPWAFRGWTATAAALFCQATHYGAPCVASSVAVGVLVASLVAGNTLTRSLEEAEEQASKYDPEVVRWTRVVNLADLKLDEGLPKREGVPVLVGHTYKAMGAAFWAVQHAARLKALRTSGRERFRKCLETVILAGGDTDTNGAVVGAVLGAYEGVSGIPDVLAEGLDPRVDLDVRILRVLSTHG